MNVRAYNDGDFERVRAIHRGSGFLFDLPDLSSPGVFSRHVVSDGTDIVMAAFLRRSAEAVLICQPKWRTPAWRFAALQQLHGACHEDARRAGVGEVNAFLVPEVEKLFGHRLLRMGWKRYGAEDWKCYSFEVKGG